MTNICAIMINGEIRNTFEKFKIDFPLSGHLTQHRVRQLLENLVDAIQQTVSQSFRSQSESSDFNHQTFVKKTISENTIEARIDNESQNNSACDNSIFESLTTDDKFNYLRTEVKRLNKIAADVVEIKNTLKLHHHQGNRDQINNKNRYHKTNFNKNKNRSNANRNGYRNGFYPSRNFHNKNRARYNFDSNSNSYSQFNHHPGYFVQNYPAFQTYPQQSYIASNFLGTAPVWNTNSENVKIFVLCETWLNETINNTAIEPNFQIFRTDRKFRRGGVCIGVHKDILASKINLFEQENFEAIAVKIIINNSSIVIVSLYIPPNNKEVYKIIKKIIEILSAANVSRYMICGDVNLDFLNISENLSKILDYINFNGIVQNVNQPTYPVNDPVKLFDVVLTKNLNICTDVIKNISSTCDHMGCISKLTINKISIERHQKQDLLKHDWQNIIFQSDNVNDAYEKVSKIISDVTSKHIRRNILIIY
ncbi:hypothetical protein B4U79_18658 [Dinothrombium tinctorium]|uniref:Endonuclease/exonuclease/phosphatase domain-containing protein n=1 Tax=Dinothrombium tinctorium TaxID=1965070 RepID=A0A3S3PF65_9ACAR|nr:hypothetical protein B4U79_18745 [Dinothrombium tinctorium]RWS00560.1 hypothetical protein B4U79_18658 [Dinothrombium tinctorium]